MIIIIMNGSIFVQLKGWDSLGGNIVGMPLTVTSVSSCVYKCTVTSECVGAVWDVGTSHLSVSLVVVLTACCYLQVLEAVHHRP